ncbi:MAG: hypothetical protein AAF039_07910 [Bacteroidota bacterium]
MKKKNSWFWNLVIVLTVIGCVFAFVLHYKNWTKIEGDTFTITSGIYSQKIPLSQINDIEFVAKLPEMERKNGFSWLAREKGVFKDSISGNTAYVFVDDLRQQKIRLIHTDSLYLYFNLVDSLETARFYEEIHLKIGTSE